MVAQKVTLPCGRIRLHANNGWHAWRVGRFLFGGWRMKRANPMRQRLAALGLLGVPLLTYPLLSLPQGEIAGIPAPYLYLFGMWTLLIVLAAVVAERRGK